MAEETEAGPAKGGGADQRSKRGNGGPTQGGAPPDARPPTEDAGRTLASPLETTSAVRPAREDSERGGGGRGLAPSASQRAEAIFSSAEQRQEETE